MATWPTSVPTDANLYIAVNELQTNLSAGINAAVTTLPLNSTTSFPTVGLVLIDNEIIKYTGVVGATLTGCTRGFDGTSAATHSAAAIVSFAICAEHHNVNKDEIKAICQYLSDNLGTGAAPLTVSRALVSNASGKITAATVTSTELGYLSGVTSAIQTQLSAIPTSAINVLDNSGFNIWQRGSTITNPSDGAYTADRWFINRNSTGNVLTKETTTVPTQGTAALKMVCTGGGAGEYTYFTQLVENYQEYRGVVMTVSLWVKSSVASTCRVQLSDSVGTTNSSYHTGSGNFELLTATRTINSATTALRVRFGMYDTGDRQNGTYYFGAATLLIGSAAATYIPVNMATDLDRCMRFYQVYGGSGASEGYILGCQATSTSQATGIFRYMVPMRAAPTVTVNNPTNFATYRAGGATDACTTIVSGSVTTQECRIIPNSANLVAGNMTTLYEATTNATITLSADL